MRSSRLLRSAGSVRRMVDSPMRRSIRPVRSCLWWARVASRSVWMVMRPPMQTVPWNFVARPRATLKRWHGTLAVEQRCWWDPKVQFGDAEDGSLTMSMTHQAFSTYRSPASIGVGR